MPREPFINILGLLWIAKVEETVRDPIPSTRKARSCLDHRDVFAECIGPALIGKR